MEWLLAVDVGNTSTSLGWFDRNDRRPSPLPRRVSTFPTTDLLRPGTFKARLSRLRVGTPAVVSSVVPKVDSKIRKRISASTGRAPLFVRWNTPSLIRNRYGRPREVGSDRLVNARAGLSLVKGPFIVVDFGTATTFDCVTANRVYKGGVIAPGPVISAEALYQRTAKLPRVRLKRRVSPLGRTTLQSIESGLYWGYRGLLNEIAGILKKKMGRGVKVISTGGQASFVAKDLPWIDLRKPHLTLTGLMLVWRDLHERFLPGVFAKTIHKSGKNI